MGKCEDCGRHYQKVAGSSLKLKEKEKLKVESDGTEQTDRVYLLGSPDGKGTGFSSRPDSSIHCEMLNSLSSCH